MTCNVIKCIDVLTLDTYALDLTSSFHTYLYAYVAVTLDTYALDLTKFSYKINSVSKKASGPEVTLHTPLAYQLTTRVHICIGHTPTHRAIQLVVCSHMFSTVTAC